MRSSPDLLHQLAVRLNRPGLPPRLVLVGADKNGCGAAIPRDEDLLVSLSDTIHQATELGLDLGKGKCLPGKRVSNSHRGWVRRRGTRRRAPSPTDAGPSRA